MHRRFAAAAGALVLLALGATDAAAVQRPVELEFSGSVRLRAETLSAAYRAGHDGSDQFLSSRVLLRGEARTARFALVGEFIDARGYWQDDGSVIASSEYNAADIFQLYAEARITDQLAVRIGRFTMPLGSGRLSDASSFSNAPANFEGVRVQLDPDRDWRVTGFFISPVRRAPSGRQALMDNRAAMDAADWNTRFYGLHLARENLPLRWRAETYVFVLEEEGGVRLVTPGARLQRPPQAGALDVDLEWMIQTGHTIAGATRLDVSATSAQGVVGYTFARANPVRLAAHISYASGDRPGSSGWNRFDPLFGGRGSDYGHTSLFGPLSRENLASYGARVEWSSGPVRARLLAHDVYLASRTDIWARGRLRDASGNSGRHVGRVIDARVSWDVLPDRATIEWGAAILKKGRFAREAPNAPSTGDSAYSYLMVTTRF